MQRTARPITAGFASLLALTFMIGSTHAQPAPDAGAPPADQPAQPDQAAAPADAPGDVGLTVYSTADPAGFDPQRFIAQQRQGHDPGYAWQVPGFGVVRQVWQADFPQGVGEVRYRDVAEFIDPTTVAFTDLAAPNATSVLQQQFQFDLVSPSKLLEKYLGQQITVIVPGADGQRETVTGELLSATQGQLVLQTDGGVRMLPHGEDTQIQLGELPGGLITQPTLVWLVRSAQAGQRPVRTTYQTAGLTWRSDYNLVLGPDETTADLAAWVTLLNLSGASYPNARLKLIAGDVQRVQPERVRPMMRGLAMAEAVADAGFEERAFFEYHLYTLPRPVTIPDNSTQQITLFPTAHNVDVEKVMVCYGLPEAANWGPFPNPNVDRNLGNQSNPKVDVYIRFQNREDNKLGVPLPRGKVRVYKEDPVDRTLEFVGEDLIDHTPRDEEVLIKVGQAFDVVGERTQTDFNRAGDMIEETFRIQLRNHKDEPVDVIIKENLFRWVNWQIVEASHDFEKVDARTIHFPVEVPARGETTVTYTVRYTW